MSNRLVKEFPKIQQPNEQVIVDLKFTNTGKTQIAVSKGIHPKEVVKILQNIAADIMFESFEMREISPIEQPPTGLHV